MYAGLECVATNCFNAGCGRAAGFAATRHALDKTKARGHERGLECVYRRQYQNDGVTGVIEYVSPRFSGGGVHEFRCVARVLRAGVAWMGGGAPCHAVCVNEGKHVCKDALFVERLYSQSPLKRVFGSVE